MGFLLKMSMVFLNCPYREQQKQPACCACMQSKKRTAEAKALKEQGAGSWEI
jgi:hypothetical protein